MALPSFIAMGNDGFTTRCARVLHDRARLIGLISQPAADRPDNSADTAAFAQAHDLDYLEVGDIHEPSVVKFLTDRRADYIFCAWPTLIRRDVFELAGRFCIGTHPTSLPRNRGRHPLHWMIVLGIEHAHVSFFILDDGIDNGPLLHQQPFFVPHGQNINQANDSMELAAEKGTGHLVDKLIADTAFVGVAQDASHATYWRRRTRHDVTLDPRLSVDAICRIVRSYCPPYPAAKLMVEGTVLNIVAARPVAADTFRPTTDLEHGSILDVATGSVTMKADDGLVELVHTGSWPHHPATGMPVRRVHPPAYYLDRMLSGATPGKQVLGDA